MWLAQRLKFCHSIDVIHNCRCEWSWGGNSVLSPWSVKWFTSLLQNTHECAFHWAVKHCSIICKQRSWNDWKHALPEYLINDIERVQKRALSIIPPDCSYSLCLSIYDFETLRSRREEQSFKLFNVISGNHKLSHLLPPKNVSHYNLRRNRKYDLPSDCVPSVFSVHSFRPCAD